MNPYINITLKSSNQLDNKMIIKSSNIFANLIIFFPPELNIKYFTPVCARIRIILQMYRFSSGRRFLWGKGGRFPRTNDGIPSECRIMLSVCRHVFVGVVGFLPSDRIHSFFTRTIL